jgi:hypothetical protein
MCDSNKILLRSFCSAADSKVDYNKDAYIADILTQRLVLLVVSAKLDFPSHSEGRYNSTF